MTTVTPIRSTRSRLRVDRTVDEIEVDFVANVYEALQFIRQVTLHDDVSFIREYIGRLYILWFYYRPSMPAIAIAGV